MLRLTGRGRAVSLVILCLAISLSSCAGESWVPHGSGSGPLAVFKYRDPGATRVSLIGDFNHWSPDAQIMKRKGDTWIAEVALKPGRYQYAFLVDGTRWQPDPGALMSEDSGFGTINSILIIE